MTNGTAVSARAAVWMRALGAYCAAYAAWLALRPTLGQLWHDAWLVAPGLLVARLCALAAADEGASEQARTAFRRLTLTALVYWLGDTLWFVQGLARYPDTIASPADVVYFAINPLYLWSALGFRGPEESAWQRRGFWLDAAIVVLGGGMVVWYAFLGPIAEHHSQPGLARLLLSYPASALVSLFGIAVATLRPVDGRARRALSALALALTAGVAGDLVFAWARVSGLGGGLSPAVYMVSYLCTGLAPYRYLRAGERIPSTARGPRAAALERVPQVAIAVGSLILLSAALQRWDVRLGGLILWELLLTGVVVARLWHSEAGLRARAQALAESVQRLQEAQAEAVAAREQALAASRAKSDFLATMSHEIRTPLNAVIGTTDLLLASAGDARQREYARTIRDGGQALLTVLDDVLDFSKIEAGKLELGAAPFSPRACVVGVSELMAPAAQAKGLRLELHLIGDLPEAVVGDEARLRQVLLNLVANGVKFTTQGQVSLRVERRGDAGPGRAALRFAVRDSGIGIAPDQAARLFQPFVQVDSAPTRRHGGTGLGLVISQRLVELMGGRLRLESAPDQGTTFDFRLELPLAAPSTPPPARAPEGSAAGLRVLVAEDNAVNQLVVRRQLEKLGHQVFLVDDGLAALETLRGGHAYDAVLLDVQMPELDGFETARRIRREHPDLGARLIALTANAVQGDRERCLDAGMDDYLSKPVTLDALRAALAGVERRRLR